MSSTLAKVDRLAPLLNSALRPSMAKVHTVSHGNPANPTWVLLGECLDAVRQEAHLTVDEFAGALERDARQVGKWLKGIERPQIELALADERFAEPLALIILRRVSKSIRVVTQITVERIA